MLHIGGDLCITHAANKLCLASAVILYNVQVTAQLHAYLPTDIHPQYLLVSLRIVRYRLIQDIEVVVRELRIIALKGNLKEQKTASLSTQCTFRFSVTLDPAVSLDFLPN